MRCPACDALISLFDSESANIAEKSFVCKRCNARSYISRLEIRRVSRIIGFIFFSVIILSFILNGFLSFLLAVAGTFYYIQYRMCLNLSRPGEENTYQVCRSCGKGLTGDALVYAQAHDALCYDCRQARVRAMVLWGMAFLSIIAFVIYQKVVNGS